MDELQMCKAFADLDGVSGKYHDITMSGEKLSFGDGANWYDYNPITDLELNCAARDKYRVTVIHFREYGGFAVRECLNGTIARADFSGITKVRYAVIECILKANNLWVE